jgi:hypothetical protein
MPNERLRLIRCYAAIAHRIWTLIKPLEDAARDTTTEARATSLHQPEHQACRRRGQPPMPPTVVIPSAIA